MLCCNHWPVAFLMENVNTIDIQGGYTLNTGDFSNINIRPRLSFPSWITSEAVTLFSTKITKRRSLFVKTMQKFRPKWAEIGRNLRQLYMCSSAWIEPNVTTMTSIDKRKLLSVHQIVWKWRTKDIAYLQNGRKILTLSCWNWTELNIWWKSMRPYRRFESYVTSNGWSTTWPQK